LGDRQHLLLSTAQCRAAIVALGGDLRKIRKRLLHARGTLGMAHIVAREHQIIRHRLIGEYAMPLDHMRKAAARRVARADAGKTLPHEIHAASIPRHQSGNGTQQCGLAGPVGTQQRNDLTRADRHLDAMQHGDLSVARFKAANIQQWFSRRDRH
jgi:hypothetical protein